MSQSCATFVFVTVFAAALLLKGHSTQANECIHSQNSDLGRIIQSQSETVEIIAKQAFEYYQGRCTLNCSLPDYCSLKQCESIQSRPTTNEEDLCGEASKHFGHAEVVTFNGSCKQNCLHLNLNFESSAILISGDPGPDLAVEACWTRQLDAVFSEVAANHTVETNPAAVALRWQYMGTRSGLTRIYPGAATKSCEFDPRVRPWYIAASSGPINVVILMDVSASMVKYGRLSRSIEVAKTILSSITNFDNVGVVLFGNSATRLQVNGSKALVKATIENVINLQNQLSADIKLMGITGYHEGFREAFALLNSSDVQGEGNSTCPSVIVLLTDGVVSSGDENEIEDLVVNTQRWNSGEGGEKKAIIFAYAVGGHVEMELPRAVACRNAGVFGHILEDGDTFSALNQYYSFLATLAGENHPVWVEPYEDAFGLGLITTVSKAIHDHSFEPPKLIGVIGVDVKVSDLKAADSNWEQTIQCLAAQVKCPAQRINLTECKIHSVRISSASASSDDLQCDSPLGNCSVNSTAPASNSTSCSVSPTQLNVCQRFENRSLDSEICCTLSPLSPTCDHINADTRLFLPDNVHISPPNGGYPLAVSKFATLLAILTSLKIMVFLG